MTIEAEESRGLPREPIGKVSLNADRRQGLTYREFVKHYLWPSTPVVITDAIDSWRALQRWTPEFFKDSFGNREVPVDRTGAALVADLVDAILVSTFEKPAPYLIGTGVGKYLLDLFPELEADILPLPPYLAPNWLAESYWPARLGRRLNRGPKAEIFFGGKGAGFRQLHWDSLHFHAFAFQIYGEKIWSLYAPAEERYLYPLSDGSGVSQVDPFSPDLEAHPLFQRATPLAVVMRPGDMLFIPAGWWHTTRIPGPSISVSINSANHSNWKEVSRDVSKWMFRTRPWHLRWPLQIGASIYLTMLGVVKVARDGVSGTKSSADWSTSCVRGPH